MVSLCVKSSNENILKEIHKQLAEYSKDEICINKRNFKIYHNIIIHYNGKNIEYFYSFLSKILTKVIVIFFEPLLIDRLLNLNYFYFNLEEKRIIIDEYKLIKEKKIYNYKYVENLIFPVIYNYLKNNKKIILSGFVDFCLPSYYSYLEKIIAEAVNQFIIDREYISFVNLLKYYVDSKIPNNTTVNLIYVNSNGILLSNNGDYLKLENFNSSYVSDISFSQNDYILNTLVGLLPSKIEIHLISPKDQFIKTIEMIFTNKVHICNGCEICKTYKLLQLQ